MINASFVWNVQCCSSGCNLMGNIRRFHPFQLTTEVFANQRLGLSAFAGEIMLESFEKKKLRQQKALRKMANDFTSCGTHWDRSYLRWCRDETASFLWSKHCSSFQSRAYWEELILSILRTIDSYWFFISSETLWIFLNFCEFCVRFLWLVQRQERGRVCLVSPVAAKGSAGRDLARARAWRDACGGDSCDWFDELHGFARLRLHLAGAAGKTTLGPIWQQDLPRGSQVAWHWSRGVSRRLNLPAHNFRTLTAEIQDPTARAIVFVQWKSLRRKLAEAFTEFEAWKRKKGNEKFPFSVFHCFFPNVSNVSKFVTPSGAICLPRGAVVGCGVGSQVPGKQMDRPW